MHIAFFHSPVFKQNGQKLGGGQPWKQGYAQQRNTWVHGCKHPEVSHWRAHIQMTVYPPDKTLPKKASVRVCMCVCVCVCVQVHNPLFSMWKFTKRLYYMRARKRQRVCLCTSINTWNRKKPIEVHICICAPWINTSAQWLVPTLTSHTNTYIPHQQTISIMTS